MKCDQNRIGELTVSTALQYRGNGNMTLSEQYNIGFWTAVALASVALCLTVTIKIGEAAAELTADEKAKQETDRARENPKHLEHHCGES